jgi:hypothetical protein
VKGLEHLGDWRIVRRVRSTPKGVHWQTANGFLLVELPPEIAEAPARARAFERDVEAFSAIFRPDIARVVDWTNGRDATYVVLEFPAGPTLRELADKTLVAPDIRARIALDALEAVEVAHANGAVFGDLDADGVVISEGGQVILLPTCSGPRAAAIEDDLAAVASIAAIRDCPRTADALRNRLRAMSNVADRETVGRLVSRVLRGNVIPPPRASSQPPPRLLTPPPPQTPPPATNAPSSMAPPGPLPQSSSSDFDDVTPVMLIDLKRARAISELSPDDLIPVGLSEPEIPIVIEEPPPPRNTERPVVSEPEIVDFRAGPGTKSRRLPLMLAATLLVACAIAGQLLWRGYPTWLPEGGFALYRALRPALPVEHHSPPTPPAAVEQRTAAAQPPSVSTAPLATASSASATLDSPKAEAASALRTRAPAKRAAPRRSVKRATARRHNTEKGPQTQASRQYAFRPTGP